MSVPRFSRRQFLKTSAMVVAGGALAACVAPTTTAPAGGDAAAPAAALVELSYLTPDRELENRMERNRDMIRERAYDRLIEAAKEAEKVNRPPRKSLFAGLKSMFAALRQPKAEPQQQAQAQPQIQLKNPCPETPKTSYQA